MKRITLTNVTMENQRKNPVYQAVIIDLVLAGALSKAKAEKMLGSEIPTYLKSPSGITIEDIDKAVAAKAKESK